MAEGYQQGPTDHTNIYQVQNAAKLTEVPAGRTWRPLRRRKLFGRPPPSLSITAFADGPGHVTSRWLWHA